MVVQRQHGPGALLRIQSDTEGAPSWRSPMLRRTFSRPSNNEICGVPSDVDEIKATILPVSLRKAMVSTDKVLVLTALALTDECHRDVRIAADAMIVAPRTLHRRAFSNWS